MYGLLNIVSLLLGLAAWAFPIAGIVRKRSICAASFGLCCLSLFSQILYTQHLVQIQDWSAIEDTHYAVTFTATVLILGTSVLNLLAHIIQKKRS